MSSDNPEYGNIVIMYAKFYLACKKCGMPVTVTKVKDGLVKEYKCLNDGCSCFGKIRNRTQRKYIRIDSETQVEYKPSPRCTHYTESCKQCGNADNFEWEEIQKGKPWLVKCSDCGHSWVEGSE